MSSDRPAIFDNEGNEIGYVDADGANVIDCPRYIFTDDELHRLEDIMVKSIHPNRDFKWGNRG